MKNNDYMMIVFNSVSHEQPWYSDDILFLLLAMTSD